MPSRHAFWSAALLLTALVLLRSWPFVWWEGAHFDSDQAIVGLMAKHISEGRAFPLFYYGQQYMLAVEAYLAAPVMLVSGATVTALKTPLVIVNVATVVLLLWVLVREVHLNPFVAVIAVLPLALPAAGVAARVTEANGGNVEPWLYVLLLWITRGRPWIFGLILGLGTLHREFTVYGALAILLMDAIGVPGGGAVARMEAMARRWAVVGVAVVATRGVASVLQPFANALGPGSRGDDPLLLSTVVDTLGGRICVDPAAWSSRAALLVFDHLPRLVGGTPAPLRDYGVLTGVYSGLSGLGPWVGAITALGLASGAWHWLRARRAEPAVPASPFPVPDPRLPLADARRGAPDISHLGGYLVLVGLISTIVYGFLTCSDIRVETLRYNLLGVLIPVGALVMALQAWQAAPARAGLGAAVVLWCAFNTSDVLALAREYSRQPPTDHRRAVADALVGRGVEVAWSPFRTAYHVTFLASERVRVSASDFSRIRSYFDDATRTSAPTIGDTPCDGGTPLPSSLYLCPAGARSR